MGNCVRRETGLEFEEEDDEYERNIRKAMDDIVNRTLTPS
jgi:hypothetical protein